MSFESALIKKDVLLSLFLIVIFISIGPFFIRDIISLFSFSGPFPCGKYFSFCLDLCFYAYHTSHSESLDVTDRMDVPVSTRSVILDTLVVGLAAVEGDSAEL